MFCTKVRFRAAFKGRAHTLRSAPFQLASGLIVRSRSEEELGSGAGHRRAGKVPFAIMQPPFEEFNPILAERPERVGVTINGKAAMEGGLRVVYDEDVRAEECALPGSGSLVLTDAASAQWVLMAKAATSFTCSVGPALPKILGPLLSQLPELPEELQVVLQG